MIDKSISLVIPAYNEGARIRQVVEACAGFLAGNFSGYEIIVVDDGSRDGTLEALRMVKGVPLKIVANGSNRGKGYSVKRGVEFCGKEYILFCDADLSTPLEETLKFFQYFQEGFDVIIGSRARPDSRLAMKQGILRRSMGKAFNLLLRCLLFKGIRDTQCGFKCFKREQARAIFSLQRIERFCFDAEILYIAKRNGLRIKESGVEWRNRRESRVAIIADSLSMFIDLFRIRINGWRGFYDGIKGEDSAGMSARAALRRDARPLPAKGSKKTLL